MIRSREDLKKYILQALGEPMIHVDVTEGQLDDRIDEALDFWQQYGYEGTARDYLKQRVTASEIYVKEPIKNASLHGTITGKDSNATAEVVTYSNGVASNNYTILCKNLVDKSFIIGETIIVGIKDEDNNISTKEFTIQGYKLGVVDEHCITMPNHVLGVVRILPFHFTSQSNNLFNVQYQCALSLDLFRNLTDTSIVYYEQAMEHLKLLDFELNPAPQFEYNRHENKVYPQMRWDLDIMPGDYLIFEVFRALDPRTVPDLWNDIFLKRYAIALTRRQWGQNLSKYGAMQLPGGMTLNGMEMYQQGQQEVQQLEEQLINQLPPSAFFIG